MTEMHDLTPADPVVPKPILTPAQEARVREIAREEAAQVACGSTRGEVRNGG